MISITTQKATEVRQLLGTQGKSGDIWEGYSSYKYVWGEGMNTSAEIHLLRRAKRT